MPLIHHSIGALSQVEAHLLQHRVHGVTSLSELLQFERDYKATRQQIEAKHTRAIEEEYTALKEKLEQSSESYAQRIRDQHEKLDLLIADLNQKADGLFSSATTFRDTLKDAGLNATYWLTIWLAPVILRINQKIYTRQYRKRQVDQQTRFEYLHYDQNTAIRQSSWAELQALADKKDIIAAIRPAIYGAIGEQKVVDALRKLSDDYILINDYRVLFHPALFHYKEKDYIQSIQIDHVLIAPSGIFLIETKNWSHQSIHNLEFRSPVQQVRRTSIALWTILQNSRVRHHHWGERKIPIHNVIVFTGHKPIGEFEYVKILALHELQHYVTRFPPCLSKDDVAQLARDLLKRCIPQKTVLELTI